MKALVRWTLRVAVTIAVVAALACVAVFWISESRLNRTYDVRPAPVPVASDAAALERGQHIATIRGCRDCHGRGLEGTVFLDDPMIGRFAASNLTRGKGGVGSSYGDTDWVRAIRHGVRKDGKPLMVMPSEEFFGLSDTDTSALIAYVKSVPPVDNVLPGSALSPLGRVITMLNRDVAILPAERIDHAALRPPVPAVGVSADYGRYLASSCINCHGATFSGGRIPGVPPQWPPAPNLTPEPGAALARWSEVAFTETLRNGVTPDGRQLDNRYMPWKVLGQMTDDELKALWLYLRSLPPKPTGNR